MATTKQDEQFAEEMQDSVEVNSNALDNAIAWIAKNLDPYEVFSKSQLSDWASGEEPDNIFSEQQLSAWAESNGYIKE